MASLPLELDEPEESEEPEELDDELLLSELLDVEDEDEEDDDESLSFDPLPEVDAAALPALDPDRLSVL